MKNEKLKLERHGIGPSSLCPLSFDQELGMVQSCTRDRCSMWINEGEMFTSENRMCVGMCAIKALAFKGKDGKIMV